MNCPACGAYNPTDAGAACLRCGALLPLSVAPDAPRCAVHREVVAVGTCARCGTFGCTACLRTIGASAFCEACAAVASDLPWDRRHELGALKAWWLTSWRLMGQPTLLAQARPGDAAGSSLFFGALAVAAGLSTTLLFYAVAGVLGVMAPKAFGAAAGADASASNPVVAVASVALLCAFFFVGQATFVLGSTVLDHLLIRVFGLSAGGFDVTLRANTLALSPYVLGLVPVCGMYVFAVWSVVLRIIALSSLHRLSGAQAAAVVLGPLFLCCGAFSLAFMGLAALR